MTRLLSIFLLFFGATFGSLGYVDHEPVMAGLGLVLVLIGLFGFTLKE